MKPAPGESSRHHAGNDLDMSAAQAVAASPQGVMPQELPWARVDVGVAERAGKSGYGRKDPRTPGGRLHVDDADPATGPVVYNAVPRGARPP